MPNPTQISLLNYHFEAAACDAVLTVMLNKSDRDYSTPDELNHATELTQFSYEEIRDALNELHRSNSTLEELENAAHMALAKFMVMSTPQMELSDHIHELEEQIPAIEEYRKYKAYHKKYASLEGKAKKKYSDTCRYELDQYREAYKKLVELFPDGKIPKIKDLQDKLDKARTDYAKQSAERKALKKEADRLSRLAQQKRQSEDGAAVFTERRSCQKKEKSA